jgi:hypothetical protein
LVIFIIDEVTFNHTKIIRESEEAYTLALERFEDEKLLLNLKKYQESLKLMEMYNRMNKRTKG